MTHPRLDPGCPAPEPCPGWGKPQMNAHGVAVRRCKCGRASLTKLELPDEVSLFVPTVDGETLQPYFKLSEAKEAIDAVAEGRKAPAPSRSRPSVRQQYRRVEGDNAAAFKQATEWFRARQQATPTDEASAYAVLGLKPGTSPEETRKAVRRLKLEWHPDRHQGDKAAAARFREVLEAAESLGF